MFFKNNHYNKKVIHNNNIQNDRFSQSLLKIEAINSQFKQIDICINYFLNEEKNLEDYDHILYHLEHFHLLINGIFERVMNFILYFYNINDCKNYYYKYLLEYNKEGKCAKYIKQKNLQLWYNLVEFQTLNDTYKQIRNFSVHDKRFDDNSIFYVSILTKIKDNLDLNNYDINYNNELKNFINRKSTELIQIIESYEDIIIRIIKSLKVESTLQYLKNLK